MADRAADTGASEIVFKSAGARRHEIKYMKKTQKLEIKKKKILKTVYEKIILKGRKKKK